MKHLILALLAATFSLSTMAQTVTAVEYYYAAWDYYFVTADPTEIAALDGGAFGGAWKRTGQTFDVWPTQAANPAASPTCRFFSIAFSPKSSHFYTPNAAECEFVKTNPADAAAWQFENIAFFIQAANSNGLCAGGAVAVPLYRLYNNGQGGAPNHRYTTDQTVFNQMVAAGWLFEGNGGTKVFACVPPASTLAIHISALPDAVAGQAYTPQVAATASGGVMPYHYQMDTLRFGFPPLGMWIDVNGNMVGTPSATYTSSQTFSFSVCVADQAATSKCAMTKITVNAAAPPGPVLNATMDWNVTDSCNSGAEVDFRFFDDANSLVWPSSPLKYYLYYNQQGSVHLSCVQGSAVCVGGQSGSHTFGNGLDDSTPYAGGACAACDGTGDPSTSAYALTFTCGTPPPPPPNGDWYYHWNCNGDPACLSTTPNGAPSGSLDEGPSYQACSPLLTFAQHFWNMPPATDSCTQTP